MSYPDLFDLANTAGPTVTALSKQVCVAVATAANAILTESGGTTNHAARLIWAQNALQNTYAWGQGPMLWAVIQDAGVQAAGGTPSDAVVQTAVDGLVNSFAY